MKKDWTPTQEAFDSLLIWLDADREQAGRKYEAIRLRLIKIFACRGCREADELADETINRVTAKVAELSKTYEGDPALFFYGVAHKLHLEYIRKISQSPPVPPPPPASDDGDNAAYDCLDQCMRELPAPTREMVLRYYQENKQAKINDRKRLAQELGIGVNALRIRAHRIRVQLQKCVEACIAQAVLQ